MTPVAALTHDEIGEVAVKKLKALGYIASLANITSAAAGEQPDALGVKACGESFLVEVKVSRNDFMADKKKTWRQDGNTAIGNYRAYLTPAGLLKPEEIPYGWQLWEVHGKTKPVVKIIKGELVKRETRGCTTYGIKHYPNCSLKEVQHFYNKSCPRSALGLLATVLHRMDREGVNTQRYANRNGKGFLK